MSRDLLNIVFKGPLTISTAVTFDKRGTIMELMILGFFLLAIDRFDMYGVSQNIVRRLIKY